MLRVTMLTVMVVMMMVMMRDVQTELNNILNHYQTRIIMVNKLMHSCM